MEQWDAATDEKASSVLLSKDTKFTAEDMRQEHCYYKAIKAKSSVSSWICRKQYEDMEYTSHTLYCRDSDDEVKHSRLPEADLSVSSSTPARRRKSRV